MQTTATQDPSPADAGTTRPAPRAAAAGWMPRTGRILTGLLGLFLLFDGAARLAGFGPYVEGTVQFGYPAHYGPWIGLTLIAATVLYLVPRTAVLGAVLLTGYLGGATAGHVRLQLPFLFPVVFGVLVWGALYLLDARLRALIPLRRPPGG